VKIQSLEDNSTRCSATSDQNGSFEFVNLKPGRYAVAAQGRRLCRVQIPSAELAARQTLRIDVTLGIKSQSQTVEVADTVAVINTRERGDQRLQGHLQITELPLNNRATTTSPLGALAVFARRGNRRYVPATSRWVGASSAMVNFSVDGISTANVRQNGALPDAVSIRRRGLSAVRVTSFNNSAEFFPGRRRHLHYEKWARAVIHGSLFEVFTERHA